MEDSSCSLYLYMKQGCSLETLVLVSRRLEDTKSGLGLGPEIKSLGLGQLVLTKKSRYFQDLDE